MAKNIFVAGLNEFHLRQLTSLRHAGKYRFHPLMSYEEVKCGETLPVREFLDFAHQALISFEGKVDAVVGFWDFPVSTVLPIIRQNVGLAGPTLESVLKCEHKYWSRLLQAKVVPELIPRFAKIDPFEDNVIELCELPYPFWLKPVKSVLSHLGFLIESRDAFKTSLAVIRENIERYADPFNVILNRADLPPEIIEVDGYHCIAEGVISKGRQCTLEGYVYAGEVQVYGAIDSIRGGRLQSSFTRYQYPSTLPQHVLDRMIEATKKTLMCTGYDNSPFNIEFYWDEEADTISLLEINTRISKSHCPLFKMVDGEYHHAVMIDIALGQRPDFPVRRGAFEVAAKFMLRCYEDGYVSSVPSQEAIDKVKETFPGTDVVIGVKEGMHLSELRDQDSYSYEIANIFMGAASEKQLLQNYETALSMLPFNIECIEDGQ